MRRLNIVSARMHYRSPGSVLRAMILYATTSGSTRLVVDALIKDLGHGRVDAYDIGALQGPITFIEHDLVVLATPTYGVGDWHSSWNEKGETLITPLPGRRRMALLALGDSRGHRTSFAGGIGKLAALARLKGAELVGAVPTSDYAFDSSPAAENGMFPGLVVEYRRDRHHATRRAQEWLSSLIERH